MPDARPTTAVTSGAVAKPGERKSGEREATLVALLALLAISAWGALWLWSASPYARYLAHDGWDEIGVVAALCRAIPQGDVAVPALLHAVAWMLMVAAMMLPTTYPLLSMVRRVTAGRSDSTRLVALVIAGFVVAWLGFGVVAHTADAALRWGAGRSAWFVANGWMVGAAVLAGAGLFQWSSLKYRCLERCRTPFGFVNSRWHGRSPPREAFRIGIDHGLFCVGCCWALMATMFVVGIGSIGWMLALAAIMAAEKNLPWGRRLATPVGVALLGWAGGIVVAHLST
jgi:predicted metal-binding membrane protein